MEAIELKDKDHLEIVPKFGRACFVYMGLPLVVHAIFSSNTFQEAIRKTILAGGDSPSRALIVGAILGASVGVQNLPVDWVVKVSNVDSYLSLFGELYSNLK